MKIIFKLLFLLPLLCFAQVSPTTQKVIQLSEVVVSGQIAPQSVAKSVKNVQVISNAQIHKMGAVSLADVLNQYINITVQPNLNTGKQTVSLFGLGGNYFKVLIDNVPLVSENGLGNNTDLSQVNMQDVERIEIVEGAMGVTHGANAVTGILNIITKKKSEHPWELTYSLQEESIGKEYSLTDQGRHIQNFKAAYQFAKNGYASVGTYRNLYNGYWGEYQGKHHYLTDNKRGYKSPPNNSLQTNIVLSYELPHTQLLYKFEYMNDDFYFIDRSPENSYSSTYGYYAFGDDRHDTYLRRFHHLNANGTWSKWRYNLSGSYQYQEREEDNYRYIINLGKDINHRKRTTQYMNVWYSVGTFSRAFFGNKLNWQLGYELTHNKGFSLITDAGSTLKEVRKNVDNYDLYTVAEVSLSKQLSVRPGMRYSVQRLFKNQYAYSLSGRYLLPHRTELRSSVGKSYRTPSFEELYTRNIFMGHAFLGNEHLLPEDGLSAEISAKKSSILGEKTQLMNTLNGSYNRINNKIHNVLQNLDGGTPHTQYINVSQYRNFNITTTNSLKLNSLELSAGASFVWISQRIDTDRFKTDSRYLLNINANASASYNIKAWDCAFSAYYKFVGKSQMWLMSGTGYVMGDLDPYGWLDISAQKRFLQKRLEVSLGARNLLNTIDVSLTQTPLQGQPIRLNYPLGYGRSFYAKLTYNLVVNR